MASSCGTKGKLTAAQRRKLPSKVFGLPRERKYPITSVSHATNAKARALQQYERGNLSYAKYLKIVAAANRYIAKCGLSEREQHKRLAAALKGK